MQCDQILRNFGKSLKYVGKFLILFGYLLLSDNFCYCNWPNKYWTEKSNHLVTLIACHKCTCQRCEISQDADAGDDPLHDFDPLDDVLCLVYFVVCQNLRRAFAEAHVHFFLSRLIRVYVSKNVFNVVIFVSRKGKLKSRSFCWFDTRGKI